jgi:hypothetical protein
VKAVAPGISLNDQEKAQFNALGRGYKAIVKQYFEVTKTPLDFKMSAGASMQVREAIPDRQATSMIAKAVSKMKERDGGIGR